LKKEDKRKFAYGGMNDGSKVKKNSGENKKKKKK
jgi:hypothetical protein